MNSNMTVEEARKIIGAVGDGISDAQLEGIIHLFSMFSKLSISQHIANKKKEAKEKVSKQKLFTAPIRKRGI